jgi:hypothetical protein
VIRPSSLLSFLRSLIALAGDKVLLPRRIELPDVMAKPEKTPRHREPELGGESLAAGANVPKMIQQRL